MRIRMYLLIAGTVWISCSGNNTMNCIQRGCNPLVGISSEQAGAGQNNADSATAVLRRFYMDYVSSRTGNDVRKTEALQKQFLTRRFFDRLQRMYGEMELDYDPFLEAQDVDKNVLDSLRIEKDSVRTDVYRVFLWDNFNRKYRKVELLLKRTEKGYRIDDILSLPPCYRDPD